MDKVPSILHTHPESATRSSHVHDHHIRSSQRDSNDANSDARLPPSRAGQILQRCLAHSQQRCQNPLALHLPRCHPQLQRRRSALRVRYATSLRQSKIHQPYRGPVPEADRKQFSQIIDIKEDGTHTLTASFQREINHAIAAAVSARRDS